VLDPSPQIHHLPARLCESPDTVSLYPFKRLQCKDIFPFLSSKLLRVSRWTERLTRLVRHKQGGIIVVEGEPGMGKTRLLEELEHESMDQRQSLDAAVPGELPAIRKMCNIFVANGDHANKSKVCQALCLMGRACHCIIMPSCIQATSRHHCDRSSRPDHSSKVKSCKLTGLAVASVINVQSLPVR